MRTAVLRIRARSFVKMSRSLRACNSFGCFSRVAPAFLFRPDAVRRRRGRGRQAHVQVLRDPTDEQEKHQRYLRGDRGGRADTYGRRHFSWSRGPATIRSFSRIFAACNRIVKRESNCFLLIDRFIARRMNKSYGVSLNIVSFIVPIRCKHLFV